LGRRMASWHSMHNLIHCIFLLQHIWLVPYWSEIPQHIGISRKSEELSVRLHFEFPQLLRFFSKSII
jgi:hypothetical protein